MLKLISIEYEYNFIPSFKLIWILSIAREHELSVSAKRSKRDSKRNISGSKPSFNEKDSKDQGGENNSNESMENRDIHISM